MTHPYKQDSETSAAAKLGRIQKACGGAIGAYAHGGRTKKSGKTEVNIIVAPSDPGGMGAPGDMAPVGMPPHPMAAPRPAMPPSGGMGAPGGVPPQVARALAERQALAARARMGAAGAMPPAGLPMRARGGRLKGGAGSGIGRLEKAAEFGNRK